MNNTMLFALLVDIQNDIDYMKRLLKKIVELNEIEEENEDE